MGLAFGALYALPFIATVITARERPEFQRPPEPFNWRRAFLDPFKMRTFVYVLLMYLFAFVAIDAVSSIVIYYMKYYLLRGDEANYVSGTLLVLQVVALPFYVWLSRRFSKRTGYIMGAFIWMIIMLFSFLITPQTSSLGVYAFAAVVGFGTGGIVVMIYAMFPDIPDVDELQSGERREGIYSALVTFIRKLSSALAIFLISNALSLAGYIPPVEEIIAGATQLIEQPQTEEFILVLRLIFVILPVIFLSIGLFFSFRYPLNAEVHKRLNRLPEVRRKQDTVSPEMQQEAKSLKYLLIGE
jgi:oligogalacturonide transporter